MKRVALLLLLALTVATAADKKVEWHTGKLLSVGRNAWQSHSGSTTNGNVDGSGNFSGTTTDSTWSHVTYQAVLQADDKLVYYAERTLSWRWQHDPLFTENAPIQWRLDKDTLILKDEHSREFKMHLVKKASR